MNLTSVLTTTFKNFKNDPLKLDKGVKDIIELLISVNKKSKLISLKLNVALDKLPIAKDVVFSNLTNLISTNDNEDLLDSPLDLKMFPNLEILSLTTRYSLLDGYEELLTAIGKHGNLELININMSGSFVIFESEVLSLLQYMRLCIEKNAKIRSLLITNPTLEKLLKKTDSAQADYYKEIQELLAARKSHTIEKLVLLQVDLKKIRKEHQEVETLFKSFPENTILEAAFKSSGLKLKELEKSFLDLAEHLITNEGKLDAGYYLAQEIKLEYPSRAYEALNKISEKSEYYSKANSMMADILTDEGTFCEIFYPKIKSAEELTDEQSEKMMDERRKKVIEHFMLGEKTKTDREVLNKLLLDYVYDGKGALGILENPFDKMPLDKPTPMFFAQLDILREFQREKTKLVMKLETELQKLQRELAWNKQELAKPSHNVLLFSTSSKENSEKSSSVRNDAPMSGLYKEEEDLRCFDRGAFKLKNNT